MAILKIIKYGENKILKEKTKPVEIFNSSLKEIVHNMIETMYYNKGIGLAANQVGFNLNLFVFDITPEKNSSVILINSSIIEKKGQTNSQEGCLSIPGMILPVKRHSYLKISGFDLKGKKIEIEAEGLLAIVLQHEMDHLKGKTIIDKQPFFKRIKIKHLLKKQS